MKTLLVVFLLSFRISIAYSQIKDSTNVYQVALSYHLEYLKKLHKNLNTVFVQLDQTTEEFPDNINGIQIRYVNGKDIKKLTRRSKIELIVVRPAELIANSVQISVIDFSASYKRKKFYYFNGGGSLFEFKYNCDTKYFELALKTQDGI
jgi:hypothetical protein